MKCIFINAALISFKNIGNFAVNQNRIGVENVVVLELYCEESVNPSLGPVNAFGEAIFFQLQGFDGDRVRCNLPGATRGSGKISKPLEAGGLAPRGPFAMHGLSLLG